jgi:hypothetical protein
LVTVDENGTTSPGTAGVVSVVESVVLSCGVVWTKAVTCAIVTDAQEPVPLHEPPWQASFVVQLFPSLQVVPSAIVGFEQAPDVGLQIPAV